MKKILVVSGSGYATSMAVGNRIKELLKKNNCQESFEIICSDMKAFDNCIFDPDIIVMMNQKTRKKYEGIPVFTGVTFLTGADTDEIIQEMIIILNER